ncbi:MAG: fibronectin type III domain-containing protein [Candidatus Pacebacteria bacterium]|nr:fibronectin type III domain-containing protein [Candidatus Paceibacterota bacterium]
MVTRNSKILLACGVLGFFVLFGLVSKSVTAADIVATITTGFFVPLNPVNIAATIGDGSVSLSWSPSSSNGGMVISDYIVEYKLTSGGVWTVFSDGLSTNTNTVVTGLSNDNFYDFRVSAVNSIGQGPPSSPVSVAPGSPAQVIIQNFSDLTIPSVVTSVRITNEGALAYEYQYTWCVTNSEINFCGGGDDVFYAAAAKLVQPGENWDANVNSTVSTTGTYWFHVRVEFGSDESYASQSFTTGTPSGGGGGGGSTRRSSKTPAVCIGADLNHDKKVSLIDFSILLVFFGTEPPFKNPCADINVDEKVDVVDFSILLSQWGKKPVRLK